MYVVGRETSLLEALGSYNGLDEANARKSRGPGVAAHEALPRLFSVEKSRGPGVAAHEVGRNQRANGVA